MAAGSPLWRIANSIDPSNQGFVGDYSEGGAAALDVLCDEVSESQGLDCEYVRRHRSWFREILLSLFDERGRTRFLDAEYRRADLIVDTEAAA